MDQIRVGPKADVVVDLRRTARAKRLSLRVSSLDGRVTLTIPNHISARVAKDFAEEKSDWIADTLARRAPTKVVDFGTLLPMEGREFQVIQGSKRSARLFADRIEAPDGRVGPAVQALLKGLARDRLVAASEGYAAKLGLPFNRITLRDTRSRWGSCTTDGNLMYSWRLIMAPPDVLQYVAAHEVAHLKHMDHSRAFWATVEALFPDYATRRDWLRREGTGLHRFRFASAD